MLLVHCSCAGIRRVCAPARAGSNLQYYNFRRNLSAPVNILLRRSSAGCAVYVASCRRDQDGTALAQVFTAQPVDEQTRRLRYQQFRNNLGASVDELVTSETVYGQRRWQWTSIYAAPRLWYVEAALRSRSLERRRENLGATIATMTQLQWISRIR